RPQVLRLLEIEPYAPAGKRFVAEAWDHVEVDLGDGLTRDGPVVPADVVAVGSVPLVDPGLGFMKQGVGRSPLVRGQIENGWPRLEGNDEPRTRQHPASWTDKEHAVLVVEHRNLIREGRHVEPWR